MLKEQEKVMVFICVGIEDIGESKVWAMEKSDFYYPIHCSVSAGMFLALYLARVQENF